HPGTTSLPADNEHLDVSRIQDAPTPRPALKGRLERWRTSFTAGRALAGHLAPGCSWLLVDVPCVPLRQAAELFHHRHSRPASLAGAVRTGGLLHHCVAVPELAESVWNGRGADLAPRQASGSSKRRLAGEYR